ncbi:MAG: hypothetical protein BWK79_09095 [Beggiatoa sp. IS2]|nr:MAG: hypothetical protein BWK79_09095 [Beggiatoa sp. IS2]
MKKSTFLLSALLGSVVATTAIYLPTGGLSQAVAEESAVYKPQVVGAPVRRVGGATRSFGAGANDLPVVVTLAPEQVALTMKAQPTLYWSLSKLTAYPVKFTLNYADPVKQSKSVEPLLELKMDHPKEGIHKVDLAEHKITLDENVDYSWSVAIILGKEESTQDLISEGGIKRLKAVEAKEMTAKLGSNSKNHPKLYAQAGLWYDAIESLSEQIEQHPNDSGLRQQRADLLKQVGLNVQQSATKQEIVLITTDHKS